MKIIINGQVFENPTSLRVEVDEAGETIGPFAIEFVGGPLVMKPEDGRAALTLSGKTLPYLTILSAALELPPPVLVSDTVGELRNGFGKSEFSHPRD